MIRATNVNLALLLRLPSGFSSSSVLLSAAALSALGSNVPVVQFRFSQSVKLRERSFWKRNFWVTNLCKKLLADALVQWHVRQHLRSNIIIRHHRVDGVAGVVRVSFYETGFHVTLPGDRKQATQRPGIGPCPKHFGQDFFYLAIDFELITQNYPATQ